jgi:dienelactone hydrolase
MASIALFHSVLGIRAGVTQAADRLRAAGHEVLVVDQYDGKSFASYAEGDRFVEELGGYPELMDRAVRGVESLPDGFVAFGFSNGGGAAEFVATQRAVAGSIMVSGSLPLHFLGQSRWPTGVPAQIHYTLDDPKRHEGWADELAASIVEVGAKVDVFAYPGSGHLFTDPTLPDEYDPALTEQMWAHIDAFLAELG